MGLLDRDITKSPFQPVADHAEQKALFDEAIRQKTPVTLWTRKKEHILSEVHLLSFDTSAGLTLDAGTGSATRKFADFIKTQGQGCFLNFGTFRCGVFFSTNFTKEIASGKRLLLEFEYPKEFFKVQRRASARLPIRAPFLLLMEYRPEGYQQLLQRKVLDISPGGLSILTTPQDGDFFARGKVLPEVRFTIRNRTILVEAEVRHARIVNEDRLPQLLVGLMFTKVEKKDQAALDAFVTDEMQSQFAAMTKTLPKL